MLVQAAAATEGSSAEADGSAQRYLPLRGCKADAVRACDKGSAEGIVQVLLSARSSVDDLVEKTSFAHAIRVAETDNLAANCRASAIPRQQQVPAHTCHMCSSSSTHCSSADMGTSSSLGARFGALHEELHRASHEARHPTADSRACAKETGGIARQPGSERCSSGIFAL